jgi:hypothetical protein
MKNPADCSACRAGSVHGTLLALIAFTSLCLNLAGNGWGTPDRWHPDEMDSGAAAMVAQHTLNPHFFPYGGLHYYVLAVTAAIPVGAYNYLFDRKPAASDQQALQAWRDRKDTRVHILARAISAVLAALTVLITYAIGRLLFCRTTGLLAALLLALSPYFVLIAHFATVDTAANFWYWLACLFALLGWKRRAQPWYALAAFTVGLACGTKLDRLLAVIPWLTAAWLPAASTRPALRRLLGWATLIPIGYIVANPTLLLSFFEFVDGTSRDLAFNALRGSGVSFVPMLADMANGMSAPTFVIFLVSLGYLGYGALRGSRPREFAWLLAAVVPMYLLFGSRHAMIWYTPFFFPGFAVVAAQGCVALGRSPYRGVRVAAASTVVAAAVWTLLRAVAVDQEFLNDSRYAATAWIERQVPRGATIEMSRRGPVLAAGLYQLQHDPIPQDYYAEAREWRGHLADSRLYASVHAALSVLAEVELRLTGKPAPQPAYQAWFDRVMPAGAATRAAADPLPAADYRVLVDYLDGTLLQALQTPGSGYVLAAAFHYRQPLGLDVPFPFLNPTTYVFKRATH